MKSTAPSAQAPPGPRPYPLAGHVPPYLRDQLGFLQDCAARYGEVVTLQIGSPTYLLNNPEDIKHVLVTCHENYVKSPRITSAGGKRLFGSGLLTSTGDTHAQRRQILRPVFHQKAISHFANTMIACTDEMLARWKPGSEIDIADEMMALVQRITGQFLFGVDFAGEARELADAITTRRRYIQYQFSSLLPFSEYLPLSINRDYRKAIEHINGAILEMIRLRRADSTPRLDMLAMLVAAQDEDGHGMSDEEVYDEALTLSTASYEVMGEALAWTFYLLARHPEAAAALRPECDEVLGGRSPSAEDLPNLRYTAMALTEAMRLYPPTWIFVRVALQDDLLPSGARVPAGQKLFLSPYVTQRSPQFFPEPERFDPERWRAGAGQNRPRFAYFPFGGGPKVCIGQVFAQMEGTLLIARIAQRSRLTLLSDSPVVPEPGITLHPKNGIKMRVC